MEIIDRKFLDVTSKTCHASSLAYHEGKPVFAWFGGNCEGLPDSSIYVQFDNKIQCMGSRIQMAHWNPILFAYKNKLFLFYKIGEFCDRWQTFYIDISDIFNDDFEIDKVEKVYLPAGLNGPVKTKPIVKNDIIYMGSSVETIFDWTSYIEEYNYVNGKFEFSHRSEPLTVAKKQYVDMYGIKRMTQGLIQPSLWIDKVGDLRAFFRSSRGLGKIYHSKRIEADGNIRWTNPEPTKFKNPNSGVDVVFDNNLFLVYNPDDNVRKPLVLNKLDDDFNTIDEIIISEEVDNNNNTFSNELSYPYMIEYEGNLHLTYTYGRSKIECVTIKV